MKIINNKNVHEHPQGRRVFGRPYYQWIDLDW
jgi:hypothetical protein